MPVAQPDVKEKDPSAQDRSGFRRFAASLLSPEMSGGILLFMLIVSVVAGLPLIALYWGEALGLSPIVWSWIQGLHSWSAVFVLALLVVHTVAVFRARDESEAPARLWVSGWFLLGVVVGMYVTGYLMSVFPTATPWLFAFHAVVFPVVLVGLVAVHMARTTKVRLVFVRTGRFLREAVRPATWFIVAVLLLAAIGFPPVV